MRAAEKRAVAKMKYKKNLDIRVHRPTDAKKSTKVEPPVGLPTEELNETKSKTTNRDKCLNYCFDEKVAFLREKDKTFLTLNQIQDMLKEG